jgi:hypothetical protein
MKASLVAYDYRELHKELEIKIVNYAYVTGCLKTPATQIVPKIYLINYGQKKSLEIIHNYLLTVVYGWTTDILVCPVCQKLENCE